MNLPTTPATYDRENEARAREAIVNEDAMNHKKMQDIEVGKNCRVIFVDTVTGTRYALTVASGAVALTAL